MTSLYRLLSYARPLPAPARRAPWWRWRSTAPGRRGSPTLIQPIFDEVLPTQRNLLPISWRSWPCTSSRALGAYLSSYLMADVGQRVVHDLRNELFRHMLGQSAAFFSLQTTGRLMSRITNDVGLLQRAVSETIGDLARETLSLVFFTGVLVYYDARLALVCFTGAPIILYPLVRLGRRVRRTSRRSQEALEQMSHVSAEAFTGHRIVKAFGAEEREAVEVSAGVAPLLSDEHAGDQRPVAPAAAHGTGGRSRPCAGALVRQPGDRRGTADDRGVRHVHHDAVPDVRARAQTEPGQRRSAAGRGGRRTGLRDSRRRTAKCGTAPTPRRWPRSRGRSSSATSVSFTRARTSRR